MALRYKRRLLDYLAHDGYEPATAAQLATDLRIEDEHDFQEAIGELAEQRVIQVDKNGLVRLPSLGSCDGEIVGRLKRNPKGFGFVIPEQNFREGDVFIPPNGIGDAVSGDMVRVEVYQERNRGRPGPPRYAGEIVEVLERKRSSFTGELRKTGGQWLVFPDGRELTEPIVVRDAEAKNASEGDKVVIEILHYPEGGSLAEGVIVRVLGEAGQPDVETQAVIAAFALPDEFPQSCVDQAREVTQQFERDIERFREEGPQALPDRLDLTEEFICTIDPPDAKDYDDAISIKRTGNGWELAVHIADVGYFIDPGTDLDIEGRDRGNSVYLPRLVIPMLPEILSNGICSLQEGVERFSKTAMMSYDKRGNVQKRGVASTIIKSAKRLTYLEAQALIDGDLEEARKHAKTETEYSDQLIEAVKEMNTLARAIKERRHKQGMISLELPDVVLIYDDNGHVIDAEQEDDAFTHTIVEMFMVEANETLAHLFENIDVPLLRRTHPEPTPADTDKLQKVATVAGYRIPKNPTREELQALLDATRGTPAAKAVHMAVLRTLTKAEYSPALIGHFALASAAYAHFTSPIRRYPDLTVHRALGEYLRRTDNGDKPPRTDKERKIFGLNLQTSPLCPPQEDLLQIGRHCTMKEENATDAERQLRQFLVLQLLEKHIGEEFGAVVTGTTTRGVFVQVDKYLADGMIKAEDLPGDITRDDRPPRYRMDEKTGALVDLNSGRSFKMGDMVRVVIESVDLARRQMNLLISDTASRAGGKAKKIPTLALGDEGGLGSGHGAGFKTPGAQRRSRKSKSRDKGKTDYRRDKKKKK